MYALLDAAFLAAAAGLAVAIGFRGRRAAAAGSSARRRPPAGAPGVFAGAALLALTPVFDNLMIAVGRFGYAPEALTGLTLGLAPIEDFAYPLAAAVLLPALWRRFAGVDREGLNQSSEERTP